MARKSYSDKEREQVKEALLITVLESIVNQGLVHSYEQVPDLQYFQEQLSGELLSLVRVPYLNRIFVPSFTATLSIKYKTRKWYLYYKRQPKTMQ